MNNEILEVSVDNLAQTRRVNRELQDPAEGDVRVFIERFALTANNVTYAVTGKLIGYWRFFPASESGWGIIPVWGFARVEASSHPEVQVGERIYGFLPMAQRWTITPARISDHRWIDGAPHRAELPPVYNQYTRWPDGQNEDSDLDDQRMLLRPLYVTSYCLADFLADNDRFGATQAIIPSASSKTAIGFADALRDQELPMRRIGLTSGQRVENVRALGLYDEVLNYDQISDIDAGQPSVIVDMSGHGPTLTSLHRHLGDNMRHTAKVGLTHFDETQTSEGYIEDRSRFFFAPTHIAKRAQDWGPGEFERRAHEFWRGAARRSQSWLHAEHHDGAEQVEAIYQKLLAGQVSADTGIIASLNP